MINEDFIELLSKSLDLETSESEEYSLDRALDKSEELRILKADLQLLKNSNELAIPECSKNTQYNIESILSQRYPRAKAPKKTAFFWRVNFTHLSTFAFSIILFSSIGLYIFSENSREEFPTAADNDSEYTLDDVLINVLETQQNYVNAIANLESLASQKIQLMPEQVSSVFRENLDIVSEAIAACESLVMGGSVNYLVYNSLIKVYEAKIELLTFVLNS